MPVQPVNVEPAPNIQNPQPPQYTPNQFADNTANTYNTQPQAPQYAQPQCQQYTQNPQYQPVYELDGVPAREVALFVGKKANVYMPKFIKKSQGKRAGLNGILLALGIIFSPIIQSFWFFHRRMNKIGAIVLAIGILLTAAVFPFMSKTVNAYTEVYSIMLDSMDEIIEGSIGSDGEIDTQKYMDAISSGEFVEHLTPEQKEKFIDASQAMAFNSLITSAIGFVTMACGVMISIFGDLFYYRFTINKIKRIKAERPVCTDNDIIYSGGTKSVVWALLLIAYIIALFAMSFAMVLPLMRELYSVFGAF